MYSIGKPSPIWLRLNRDKLLSTNHIVTKVVTRAEGAACSLVAVTTCNLPQTAKNWMTHQLMAFLHQMEIAILFIL